MWLTHRSQYAHPARVQHVSGQLGLIALWKGRRGGAPLSISPPQNLAHRLQHVLILWSIFFSLNGCLVSRGSFGFVFVWVLVLSFTYAMYELIFLVGSRLFSACVQTDVCIQASLFSGRFFSECVEFPLSLFPIRSGMLYL